MTDLEITKLCAESLGWKWIAAGPSRGSVWVAARYVFDGDVVEWDDNYDPLHDDGQCLALVKRLGLNVEWIPESAHIRARWLVSTRYVSAAETDLNRAVCSCVAQMQAAKATA